MLQLSFVIDKSRAKTWFQIFSMHYESQIRPSPCMAITAFSFTSFLQILTG